MAWAEADRTLGAVPAYATMRRYMKSVGLVRRRAVGGEPSILLADEPTGNLDSKNGEAVMELLSELHQSGATICMVTHDARYASHAKRTIHLFDGRVVEESVAAV